MLRRRKEEAEDGPPWMKRCSCFKWEVRSVHLLFEKINMFIHGAVPGVHLLSANRNMLIG